MGAAGDFLVWKPAHGNIPPSTSAKISQRGIFYRGINLMCASGGGVNCSISGDIEQFIPLRFPRLCQKTWKSYFWIHECRECFTNIQFQRRAQRAREKMSHNFDGSEISTFSKSAKSNNFNGIEISTFSKSAKCDNFNGIEISTFSKSGNLTTSTGSKFLRFRNLQSATISTGSKFLCFQFLQSGKFQRIVISILDLEICLPKCSKFRWCRQILRIFSCMCA